MKNLRVAQKLALGFGAAIVLSIVLSVVSIISSNSIDASYSHLLDYPKKRLEILYEVSNRFALAKYALAQSSVYAGIDGTSAHITRQYEAIDRELEAVREGLQAFITSTQNDDQYTQSEKDSRIAAANDLLRFTTRWYNEAVVPMIEANRAGDRGLALSLSSQIAPMSDELFDAVDDLVAKTLEFANSESAATTASVKRIELILIVISVVVVLVSLAFAILIALGIVGPLKALTSFMERAGSTGDIALTPQDIQLIDANANAKDEIGHCISSSAMFIKRILEVSGIVELIADGDLTAELKALSDKDVLVLDMIKMSNSLSSMFSEINSSANQVSTGSKQVADGAQALAQGATEQAASIEQLSSSMNEIARKTKENAEMADRAATLSNSIMGSAEKGSFQMDDMMKAVKEINDASQSIGKIIKTIDDIAFQTNILALNAAVEAARAGQAGKGFAVVAEEVRNLAAKSAEAAKETGVMIQNSMEKAELGARIANDTASSLTEIVTGINESTVLIGDISRSSEEQSMGISQINTGIDQVAQVVQQNAATAQQSAAASQQMSAQSDVLQGLASQFKIKKELGGYQSLPSGGRRPPARERPVIDEDVDYGQISQPIGGEFGKY